MKKNPQLILVDDHLPYRESLKSILTTGNIAHVIGEATNGVEFIELLSSLKPDLVLMDINIPKMNGMEAIQKALELKPDLKIIAYTMFGEEEYYHKMIAHGVNGFIRKSCSIRELKTAIREVMLEKTYFSISFQETINRLADDTIGNNTIENKGFTGGESIGSLNYESTINPMKY